MASLQFPPGNYEPGRAVHRPGRGWLKRAESFHPDEQVFLKGPDWNHSPLRYVNFYLHGHRTIRAYTSYSINSSRRRALPSTPYVSSVHRSALSSGRHSSGERALSCDHVRRKKYRRRCREPQSEGNGIDQEETKEDRRPDISKIPFDSSTLCDKCHGVSLESLTAEGGYVHSTLDQIRQQAKFCHLCRFIIATQDLGKTKTLDRYQINLSLNLGQIQHSHSDFDHVNSQLPFRKVLWISTRDIRPHELPEGKLGQQIKKGDVDWNPPNPGCKYRIVHERSGLCYTDEGDLAKEKGVPWLRDIGENTASAESFRRAQQWLEECLKATAKRELDPVRKVHAQMFATEAPARLLHIANLKDAQNSRVRLIETRGTSYRYATLSYCWGASSSEWLCTKQNVDHYFLDIDRMTLPATLRDSIVIAANLGINYIWIDALCIIQDCTSDWAAESAKMGGIYHGSLLTIAASASSESTQGCFNTVARPRYSEGADDRRRRLGHLDQRRIHPESVRENLVLLESRLQSGSLSRLYIVRSAAFGHGPHDDIYEEEVVRGSLSSRAWVFQEQYFSRRIIYYAQSQLFWECEHCRLSEDNLPQQHDQQIYPILSGQKPLNTAEIIKSWYHGAVQTYTSRSLTNKHDKLVAISAVARATYLNRSVEYYAGIWEDCILQGLVWERSSSGNKSKTYVCPSWSWASQDSSVHYRLTYDKTHMHIPYQPKVLDIHVDRDPKNHFGDVSGGHVKLDTLIASGWVLRRCASEVNHVYQLPFIFRAESSLRIWYATVVMDDHDYVGHGVTVALISSCHGDWVALVLELLPEGKQTYRRIGILTWTIFDQLKIKSPERIWKKEIITIV